MIQNEGLDAAMREQRSKALDYRRKDRIKACRVAVQIVILAFLAGLIVKALFTWNGYDEPDRSRWNSRNGFVAVSYFGVDHSGTSELIAKEKLEEQLKALYERGYVTISQDDVLAYYNEGKPLPEKALFLAFEDGRNDSALFAEPLLKKYNFKATLLTYANKFGSREGKFLQPKELLKMTRSGYWELGSNGYRLSYINIVDEHGQFLGERAPGEFPEQKTARYYTHYLMDFIRDADGVPIEHRDEMEARIGSDYEKIKNIYTQALGYVPRTYMIMHANTLYNGMNPLVQAANDKGIRELFQLHFNREGNAMNTAKDSPLNLTRLQPAPYWETNHLLMELRRASGRDLAFVTGDKTQAEQWKLIAGAAEFAGDRIALTSPPSDAGMLALPGSEAWDNVDLRLRLGGHYSGEQSVFLRYSGDGAAYVRLLLREGEFAVEQKAPGEEPEKLLSVPFEAAADGRNRARLRVQLLDGKLSVALDGSEVLSGQPIDERIASGALTLAAKASPEDARWNEYDEQDTIYDGVFEAIEVREAVAGEEAQGKQLYSNRLNVLQLLGQTVARAYRRAVDWAIETF